MPGTNPAGSAVTSTTAGDEADVMLIPDRVANHPPPEAVTTANEKAAGSGEEFNIRRVLVRAAPPVTPSKRSAEISARGATGAEGCTVSVTGIAIEPETPELGVTL